MINTAIIHSIVGSCDVTYVQKGCVENNEKKYFGCRHFVLLDKIDCLVLLIRSQMQ